MDGITGGSNEIHLTNSSDVLTKIEGLISLNEPNPVVGDVDNTDQDSAGIGDSIPGVTDLGSMTFVVKHVPGSATELLIKEHRDSKEKRAFKIVNKKVTPNRQTTGTIYINSYTPDNAEEGTLRTATVTAKITTAIPTDGDVA